MSTLTNLTNICETDSCLSQPQHTDASLSSFDIIFVAACSSFLTLIVVGLLNFLKINIKRQKSTYQPPPKPDYDAIFASIKESYNKQQQQQKEQSTHSQTISISQHSFPPQNRYYPIISAAFKVFVDAINGTERDGWIYLGEKRGVKRYRRDIHSSVFSTFRGEKILNYPPNLLLHAIRDKKVRLFVGDGQMIDCGALEIIDENCKIEYEEYKSPAPFVGAREFVYIDTIHRMTDGTIISFGRSLLHPRRPKSSKFTRADLKIGGWALQPIRDEPSYDDIVYTVFFY